MSQVVPEDPAEIFAAGDGHAGSSPAARQTARCLLTAWLLLLLERQPTHGYELGRRLEAHGVVTNAGAMYRTLRKLEQDGYTSSTWEKSVAGPRRRHYRLTAQGLRELDRRVKDITVTRDVNAAFLDARAGARGPASGTRASGSLSA